jgi:hypothetical protein
MPDKSLPDWIDIPPLPVPETELGTGLIFTAILFLGIFILLYRYWWLQPKRKARRQLRRLTKKPGHAREQLFLIGRLLREGFQITHLQQVRSNIRSQDEWQRFSHELIHQSYAAATPDPVTVLQLAQQAQHWLKQV